VDYRSDDRIRTPHRSSALRGCWPLLLAPIVFACGLHADQVIQRTWLGIVIGGWWMLPLIGMTACGVLARRSYSSVQLWIGESLAVGLYVAICLAIAVDRSGQPDPLNVLAYAILPLYSMMIMIMVWIAGIACAGFAQWLVRRT
jgi:hypothetical protein